MSFKLSALLNPAPSPSREAPATSPKNRSPSETLATAPPQPQSQNSFDGYTPSASFAPATTAYEAANALTVLATSGAPPTPYVYGQNNSHSPSSSGNNSYDQYSPARGYSETCLPSFGAVATPVEPSPPMERSHNPTSPTLEQYHHGSKSPEEQRRMSLMSRNSGDAPRLAPIQGLSNALNEAVAESPREQQYGVDRSRVVASPQDERMRGEEINHVAQHREPSYVRDEPTTSRIREPSVAEATPGRSPALGEISEQRQAEAMREAQPSPKSQEEVQESAQKRPAMLQTNIESQSHPDQLSPLPHIKAEPSATPNADSPATAPAQPSRSNSIVSPTAVDPETAKAIAEASNEYGTRKASREKSAPSSQIAGGAPAVSPTTETAATASAPPKKRPAPKNSAAANKKGVAKKPPAKKRKIEDNVSETTDRRSATPNLAVKTATSKTKSSVTSKKSQSNTPAPVSSPTAASPAASHTAADESEDDDGVYCICHRGDNHTWMIGCDGGCEDWFHGSCVKVDQRDEDLIDKYICPNCEAAGRGQTTWKRVCRNQPECRKPARMAGAKPSKYCSDTCGKEFMRKRMLGLTSGGNSSEKKSKKDWRKANMTDNTGNEGDDVKANASDDDVGPRGGVLRARELKALVTNVKSVDEFHRLGDGVLSPPSTVSPTKESFPNGVNGTGDSKDVEMAEAAQKPSLNPVEKERTEKITEQKDALRARRALLKDREKFLTLVKEQVARYTEREGLRLKEVCGFDSRLSWSEEEFDEWRNSKPGAAAMSLGTLELGDHTADTQDTDTEMKDADDAEPKVNGVNGSSSPKTNGSKSPEAARKKSQSENKVGFLCTKKRCDRHKQWQKLILQDVRFEEAMVAEQFRALDGEEKEIKERALLRGRIEDGMKGEGSVEMLA